MSLATMQRTPGELLGWLFAAQSFPHGVALLTGTSMVPPGDLTLRDGDVVTVSSAELGALENPVVTVGARDADPADKADPGAALWVGLAFTVLGVRRRRGVAGC